MFEVYHAAQLPLFVLSKVCPQCQTEKPFDAFRGRSDRDGKLHSWCKACTNEHRRLKRIRNTQHPPEREPLPSLICKQCQIEKPITAFYVDPLNSRGYRASCKDCVDLRDPRTKKRGKRRKIRDLPVSAGYKRCWICEMEKPLEAFIQVKQSPDGRHSYCDDCRLAQRREQWLEMREEVLPRQRARYQTISDEERERRNAYNRKNSKKPQYRLKTAEKSRRRREAYRSDKVDYQAILDRDGSVCYICGKGIDSTIDRHSPGGLNFDHIIPLNPRPGNPKGTHEESNIKPCHYVCNCRKANKPLEEMTAFQRRGPD